MNFKQVSFRLNLLTMCLLLKSFFFEEAWASLPPIRGGVLTQIESNQTVGPLSEVLKKTASFKQRYLYLSCEGTCQNYQVVISENPNLSDAPFEIFHPNLTQAKQGHFYLDEVWLNTRWPMEQYLEFLKGNDEQLGGNDSWKLLLAPAGISASAVVGMVMPGYAGIGRTWRKTRASKMIDFLKDPTHQGEIRQLSESAFTTNYPQGKFNSQLFSFLLTSEVPGMFRPIRPKNDKTKFLPLHKLSLLSACGLNTKNDIPQKYCLQLAETEKVRMQTDEIILLIPGFFQNAYFFDLAPEKNISVLRYLEEKYAVKAFVLNSRSLLGGDFIAHTNLDDVAIDDISTAVNYLSQKFQTKISVIGHSQGAITLQAYSAGLSRCGKVNCFISTIAQSRQQKLKSLGLIGGNPTMVKGTQEKGLKLMAQAGVALAPLLKLIDTVPAKLMNELFFPVTQKKNGLALSKFWGFLYNLPENSDHPVSDYVRIKLYEESLDHSFGALIVQYAQGVIHDDLRATSGESYAEHLKLIQLPVYHLAFGDDALSPPDPTEDTFMSQMGSQKKVFEEVVGRGHEDVFMREDLHPELDRLFDFVVHN